MAAGEQGNGLVQERARVGDDAGPADGIEGVAGGGAVGGVDGVGAIEGVVETAPAGVGGIERVAGVHHGHDELRAGDAGDLVIGVGCGNLKRRGRSYEVADAREKVFVVIAGEGGGGICRVPSVDLGLKIIAAGEQGAVARGEVGDESAEGRPKRFGGDAGAGQDLAGGELGEDRGDAQAAERNVGGSGHGIGDGKRRDSEFVRKRGGAGAGDLAVLDGGHAGDADRADDAALVDERETALDRSCAGERERPETFTAGGDEVLENFGGTAKRGGGGGLAEGDFDAAVLSDVHALEEDEMTAGVHDGDDDGPLVGDGFGVGGGEDGAGLDERDRSAVGERHRGGGRRDGSGGLGEEGSGEQGEEGKEEFHGRSRRWSGRRRGKLREVGGQNFLRKSVQLGRFAT